MSNPIPTVIGKSMMSLKCRNGIIISPHPRAKRCCSYAAELINSEFKKLGAPNNLIQMIREPTIELTDMLMRYVM